MSAPFLDRPPVSPAGRHVSSVAITLPRSEAGRTRREAPRPGSGSPATDEKLLVVGPQVSRQARSPFRDPITVFNVNIFVFHTPPRTLREHVVQRPPPTVLTHGDTGLLQAAGVVPR